MTEPTGNGQKIVVATYEGADTARRVVERLNERDFPMDMVSVLGKAHASGDDALGIYYPGVGRRIKAWGAMGALWGGLWGLLAGAAGMFLIPGVGPVLAAGPVVEALVGAVAGAALTGGAMTGAAALSQLGVALHRMGVPKEKLDQLRDGIAEGRTVVLLRADAGEVDRWRAVLEWSAPVALDVFPFRRLTDLI